MPRHTPDYPTALNAVVAVAAAHIAALHAVVAQRGRLHPAVRRCVQPAHVFARLGPRLICVPSRREGVIRRPNVRGRAHVLPAA